jgi:hypothetical protein
MDHGNLANYHGSAHCRARDPAGNLEITEFVTVFGGMLEEAAALVMDG